MRGVKRIFPGHRFGRWTVEKTAFNDGQTHYRVVCDCGNRQTVTSSNLLSGRSTQCSPCSRAERRIPRVVNMCPDCNRRAGMRQENHNPKPCKRCCRSRRSAANKYKPRTMPVSIGLIAYEAKCTRQNVSMCIKHHGWDGMVKIARDKWGVDVGALASRSHSGASK